MYKCINFATFELVNLAKFIAMMESTIHSDLSGLLRRKMQNMEKNKKKGHLIGDK